MKNMTTTRRTNLRPILANRITFQNSTGSLRGYAGRGESAGRLAGADRDAFDAAWSEIDYIVFSYQTPIAWHTPKGWHVVEQKFSATTSNHQSQVRRGLSA